MVNASVVDFGPDNPATIIGDSDGLLIVAPAGTAGTVDITVTTIYGTSPITTADEFTYVPPPAITGLSRTSGVMEGGSTITITGTNLTDADVNFGPDQPADILSESDTQVVLISPPGSGTVDVTATTQYGTSSDTPADQFTFTNAPYISSVVGDLGYGLPTGLVAGGDSVTILGDDLDDATAVSFGGTATTIISDTANELSWRSPAGAAATVDISVTTANGITDITPADQYTYLAVPAITGLSSSTGSDQGRTEITISGSGLAGATSVAVGTAFGDTADIVSDSDTQLVITTPPNGNFPADGTVDITVTTPGGASAITSADEFTYGPAPRSPASARRLGRSPAATP